MSLGLTLRSEQDGGATFETLQILNGTSETALAWLAANDSSLYYNARHMTGKETGTARVVGWSKDRGLHWNLHQDPNSPPDTPTDAVPGPLLETNGRLFLALPLGPGRSNIAVHASDTGGLSWPLSTRSLDAGYGGYSGLAALPGGEDVGLVYEADAVEGMECKGPCSIAFRRVPFGLHAL